MYKPRKAVSNLQWLRNLSQPYTSKTHSQQVYFIHFPLNTLCSKILLNYYYLFTFFTIVFSNFKPRKNHLIIIWMEKILVKFTTFYHLSLGGIVETKNNKLWKKVLEINSNHFTFMKQNKSKIWIKIKSSFILSVMLNLWQYFSLLCNNNLVLIHNIIFTLKIVC